MRIRGIKNYALFLHKVISPDQDRSLSQRGIKGSGPTTGSPDTTFVHPILNKEGVAWDGQRAILQSFAEAGNTARYPIVLNGLRDAGRAAW